MSITRVKTWADEEQLTASDLNAEFDNLTDNALNAATQNEVNNGTSNTVALTPLSNLIILGTNISSTSGTTISFSSIPSGVRRVTINFQSVSTGGTSDITVQIGDSGGLENTNYTGSASTIAGTSPTSTTFSTSFVLTDVITAASTLSGTMTLTLSSASLNLWCMTSVLASGNTGATHFAAGAKGLSAELTQLQISSVSGDTFDGGSINITYER